MRHSKLIKTLGKILETLQQPQRTTQIVLPGESCTPRLKDDFVLHIGLYSKIHQFVHLHLQWTLNHDLLKSVPGRSFPFVPQNIAVPLTCVLTPPEQ